MFYLLVPFNDFCQGFLKLICCPRGCDLFLQAWLGAEFGGPLQGLDYNCLGEIAGNSKSPAVFHCKQEANPGVYI